MGNSDAVIEGTRGEMYITRIHKIFQQTNRGMYSYCVWIVHEFPYTQSPALWYHPASIPHCINHCLQNINKNVAGAWLNYNVGEKIFKGTVQWDLRSITAQNRFLLFYRARPLQFFNNSAELTTKAMLVDWYHSWNYTKFCMESYSKLCDITQFCEIKTIFV